MAALLHAPELGGDRKPGVLVRWYRDDGTDVAAGDAVLCFESDYVAIDVEAQQPGRLHRCYPPGTSALPGNVIALILAPGELVPEHEEDPLAVAGIEPPPPEHDHEEGDDAREPILLPLRRGALKSPPNPPAGGAWDRAFGGSGHDYSGFWPLRDELPEAGAVEAAEPPVEAGFAGPAAEVPGPEDVPYTSVAPVAWPKEPADDPWHQPGENDDYEPVADYVDEPVEDYQPAPEPAPEPEPGVEPESAVIVPWRAGHGQNPIEEPAAVPVEWAEPAAVYTLVAPVALHGTVRLTELRKLCDQLGREWRESAPAPRNEDLVLRAAARAVLESEALAGLGDSAGLVVPGRAADGLVVLDAAARGSLRERVVTLASAPEAGSGAQCSFTVTTFASFGVDDAIPVIPEGHVVAFAMGATRPGSVMDDGIPAPVMTLTLAYMPDSITQGEAATFFARVRELIEAPYALLAD